MVRNYSIYADLALPGPVACPLLLALKWWYVAGLRSIWEL